MNTELIKTHWGATSDEWLTFDVLLGLTRDMLPVVSKLEATISPNSTMKALGKTPSVYNRKGHAVGIPDWTTHKSTPADILGWSQNPDYSICLIGREAKAVDVDVTDADLAARVKVFIADHLGVELPMRFRVNSPKFLLAFRLNFDMPKRVIKTEHGIIELLNNSQQFVVAGTHTSVVRYEWTGLDDGIPQLTLEQFNSLWSALQAEFGVEPAIEGAYTNVTKAERIESVKADDPLLQALHDRGLVLSNGRDGQVNITCPFAHEHTTDSGGSSTTYFAPHTGGHAESAIKCLHAHCAHRTTQGDARTHYPSGWCEVAEG